MKWPKRSPVAALDQSTPHSSSSYGRARGFAGAGAGAVAGTIAYLQR